MPDFSLGFGNLYGRFVKDEKQPERRSTAGGQSGSRAYSQRDPSPKPIGGPLVTSAVGLTQSAYDRIFGAGEMIYGGARELSGDLQDISGKTQRATGDFFGAVTGAPKTVIEGATQPIGQLSKDILPLAAIAAAIVLLK